MVIRSNLRSIPCVLAAMFAFGCSGTGADHEYAEDEELELDSVEQAIIPVLEEPAGPAQQCLPACMRYDVSGAIDGQCCVCNGAQKTFQPASFSAYMYLCR